MSLRTAGLTALLLVTGLSACASSSSTHPAASSGSRSVRAPDLISAQEIAATAAVNAYDVVMRLRPQWFRSSGVASVGGGAVRQGSVIAYVDNVKLGAVDNLRSISAAGITSIRYMNAEMAASRLPDISRDLISGAVIVSTK
ncbi:MAG TPA: hypothetical protein VMM17_08435 [Gemmatimonadaceae bacterium]|nr:hypothetical protein [Gemmatimonadaceae bacterium]